MFLMKSFSIIVCLVQLFTSSQSINVECQYRSSYVNDDYSYYLCQVQNDLNITSRQSLIVDSVSVIQDYGKNDKTNPALSILRKTVHFFPRGLENVFGDLKFISIESCYLKEVHQSDLRPFTHLEYLDLGTNDIKVLEKGLFDFNLMLNHALFYRNKIVHIDVDVFQHLNKLSILWLGLNTCINNSVERNETALKEVIKEIQQKCQDQDFLTIESNLKELEGNLVCQNSENSTIFDTKLEQVQSEASTSKFSEFFEFSIQELAASRDQKCQEEIQTTEKSQHDLNSEIKNFENLELTIAEKFNNLQKSVDEIKAIQKSMNANMSNLEASFKNLEKLIKNDKGSV